MSYLATLPVDGLKIDRSFVSTMGSSPEGLTLSRMVVQLANSLDLATVAEGIETIEQADLLRGMGCEYGPGLPVRAADGVRAVPRVPARAGDGPVARRPLTAGPRARHPGTR